MERAMMNSYPRESTEFEATQVTVTIAGVATVVTAGVLFAVTPNDGSRPVTFTPATLLSGNTGFLVGTYAVGYWKKWAQVTGYSPEIPVIDCGLFQIT
jgi:hypothetical protein